MGVLPQTQSIKVGFYFRRFKIYEKFDFQCGLDENSFE